MADPLSIAAGIAGFLSLGIQVTQTLIEFYSAYKNQDTDVAKITRMIENLQSTFRFLQIAVQQRQAQANAEELLQKVDNTIQACHEIIQELQTECQKLHTDSITGLKGRFQVAGRRAAYPFRKSTIHKIEEDVGEIRGNLSFALNVLQYKSHNRIEDEISEVKYLLERTNTSQISLAIRAWLMAPDAYMNHHAIYAKHHPSTGLWFINGHHFANWLVERNSFLWLNGFAGCGKSVLCSTAIQYTFNKMKHQNEVAIAIFYFSFTDKSSKLATDSYAHCYCSYLYRFGTVKKNYSNSMRFTSQALLRWRYCSKPFGAFLTDLKIAIFSLMPWTSAPGTAAGKMS